MPEKFKFSPSLGDKEAPIKGPFEALVLMVDFDDVDHHAVQKEARKLCKILNEHWNKKPTAAENFAKLRGGVMDIYARPGSRVEFAFPANGYPHQGPDAIKAGLVVGSVYTVGSTEVHDSSSYVMLMEFPGKSFNTVLFAEAK